jgi:hypothetical protein
MASFTTRSVVPSTSWVPNRASRPARTVICSAAAPSNFPSVEQHFGSKALEQFEKVKLEQLDTSDLASLAQELKQRGECGGGGGATAPFLCSSLLSHIRTPARSYCF